jgi:hypothetical protein
MKLIPLYEIASVIRSKNAGPYELTFDIIFKDAQVYRQIKKTGFLSPGFLLNYIVFPWTILFPMWNLIRPTPSNVPLSAPGWPAVSGTQTSMERNSTLP